MRNLRRTTWLVVSFGMLGTFWAGAQTPGRAGEPPKPAARVSAPQQQAQQQQQQPMPPGGPLELKVIPLKHAESNELCKLLRQVAFPGTSITVDSRTNSLIIAAEAEHNLPQLLDLVERLDGAFETAVTPPNRDPMQVTTVRLKAADAMRVCKLLLSLIPRNTDVRILPDEPSRSLWIGGDKDDVAKFAALATQMDVQAAEGRADARETRFFRLKNADCRPLSATINDYMKTMELDVRVVADAQSNTILAFATTAQNDHLTRLINELDVPAVRRPGPEKPAPAGERGGGGTGGGAGGEIKPESN